MLCRKVQVEPIFVSTLRTFITRPDHRNRELLPKKTFICLITIACIVRLLYKNYY